jgi:HAD superfamily hydrolase (TIGR01450 family)
MSVKNLNDIECFIFDMDGTLNLGDTPIQGARELIAYLVNKGVAHYFFTNNSSKSPKQYVKKLNSLCIQNGGIRSIITSGNVTASYILSKVKRPKIYVCGTKALKRQLIGEDIEVTNNPNEKIDFVLLGFDTELDYKKLCILTDYIDSGIPFLATNIDDVCPIEGGKFLTDCGSMAKMVENATNVKPRFLGKPAKETVDFILKKTGINKDKIAIVGDRLYTDILTAHNGGLISIGVLSGEMTKKEINQSEVKPEYLFDSVLELLSELTKGEI